MALLLDGAAERVRLIPLLGQPELRRDAAMLAIARASAICRFDRKDPATVLPYVDEGLSRARRILASGDCDPEDLIRVRGFLETGFFLLRPLADQERSETLARLNEETAARIVEAYPSSPVGRQTLVSSYVLKMETLLHGGDVDAAIAEASHALVESRLAIELYEDREYGAYQHAQNTFNFMIRLPQSEAALALERLREADTFLSAEVKHEKHAQSVMLLHMILGKEIQKRQGQVAELQ